MDWIVPTDWKEYDYSWDAERPPPDQQVMRVRDLVFQTYTKYLSGTLGFQWGETGKTTGKQRDPHVRYQ